MADRSISFIAYHQRPAAPFTDPSKPYIQGYYFPSLEEFLSLYYADKFIPKLTPENRIADQKFLIDGKEYKAVKISDLVDTVSYIYWIERAKERENAETAVSATEEADQKLIFSDNPQIPEGGIFLAGPTHRKNGYNGSWRQEAVKLFREKSYYGHIYIPEYADGKEFVESDESIRIETEWEWEALSKAKVIMFWVPRELKELPAFTTNIEFGRYTALSPEKIILGYPDTAVKMRYMELLYDRECNKKPKHTLEKTVISALRLYNRL